MRRPPRPGGAALGRRDRWLGLERCEKLTRFCRNYRLRRRLAGARGEYRGELPDSAGGVEAQDKAPAIVDAHVEIAVRGVRPAVEDRGDGEPVRADVKGARGFVARKAAVAGHTDLHWRSLQVSSLSKQ